MKLEWHKVTWYSKMLALGLFIILPFIGFYFGVQYQKILELDKSTQIDTTKKNTDKKDDNNNLTDSNKNRNRSCGKATIEIINYLTSKDKALEYFEKNGLEIFKPTNDSEPSNWLNVGRGKDTYWIAKLKEDGIAEATYDTIGCDFID